MTTQLIHRDNVLTLTIHPDYSGTVVYQGEDGEPMTLTANILSLEDDTLICCDTWDAYDLVTRIN